MHLKKGDKVIVIAGKDKGKSSVVAKVLREENRVILDGLNMVKKHTRPAKAGEKGGIIAIAMSIHASNVKLADKVVKKEVKVSTKKKVTKKTTVKTTVIMMPVSKFLLIDFYSFKNSCLLHAKFCYLFTSNSKNPYQIRQLK